MINLNTGVIEIDGVVITPTSSLKDFEKYGDKVDIHNRGNGRGVVRLVKMINSDGVNAGIKIYIDENDARRKVVINPLMGNCSEMGKLEASKQWLRGMAIGEYIEDNDSLYASSDWGYMVAQYHDDRDYGTIGGEIIIKYKGIA